MTNTHEEFEFDEVPVAQAKPVLKVVDDSFDPQDFDAPTVVESPEIKQVVDEPLAELPAAEEAQSPKTQKHLNPKIMIASGLVALAAIGIGVFAFTSKPAPKSAPIMEVATPAAVPTTKPEPVQSTPVQTAVAPTPQAPVATAPAAPEPVPVTEASAPRPHVHHVRPPVPARTTEPAPATPVHKAKPAGPAAVNALDLL